jgi:cellulose synthase/poly-beta-1,6-N-acetylglucosamine synthase-like glycosyltransferase
MISIVITSFKEPKTIGKAIESFLNQNIKEKYELIVCAPDKETLDVAKKYKKVKIFKDPGKGKSYALNMLLHKLKGNIIILTDGDVYAGKNSVKYLLEKLKDEKTGCVTAQPVSSDSKKNIFGYWGHVLCYAAHILRKERADQNKFLECSGYLWAFKNKIITTFPKDAAEDTIVPVLLYLKGWKIAYAPEAKVFVKFPNNLHDFIEQKKRTAKGHESLYKYVDIKKFPRMKTFKNEVLDSWKIFSFPQNLIEFTYTFLLFPIRLYIWALVFYHTKVKKQEYKDAWKRVESTK